MKNTFRLMVTFFFVFTASASSGPPTVMEKESSEPGESVTRKGNPINLLGNAISIGNTMPSVELVDSGAMKSVDLY